jgi:hypothetical protein
MRAFQKPTTIQGSVIAKSAMRETWRSKGVWFDRVESINQSMNTAVASESEKKRARLKDMNFYSTFTRNRKLILWAHLKFHLQAVCKPLSRPDTVRFY